MRKKTNLQTTAVQVYFLECWKQVIGRYGVNEAVKSKLSLEKLSKLKCGKLTAC